MGLLIKNALAVLPAEAGHDVGCHDIYVDGVRNCIRRKF